MPLQATASTSSKDKGAYTRWAVALTKHFFGPQFRDTRTRLTVTRDVLDTLFMSIGGTQGFLQALNVRLAWAPSTEDTVQSRGQALYRAWKDKKYRPSLYPPELTAFADAPPYIPHLCLLSLAWTEGASDIDPNAFYTRLDRLCPTHGFTSARLAEWDTLWWNLQDWTERAEGTLGQFVVEKIGAMSHVGIPKSQVIFTQSKIQKLPHLFSACSMQPGLSLTPDEIHAIVRANPNIAKQTIGRDVYDEIEQRTPLGNSAISLLNEFLEDWDGNTPQQHEQNEDDLHHRNEVGRIGFALQPREDNTRWKLLATIEADAVEGINVPDLGWHATSIDPGIAFFTNSDRTFADGTTLLAYGAKNLRANRQVGADHSVELELKISNRNVWIFENWRLDFLVDQESLPHDGGVYVLVSHQAAFMWSRWTDNVAGAITLTDYTWKGLPEGWKLYFLTNLKHLSCESRASFPDGSGNIGEKGIRPICFVGGTKVQSSTARRIFAEYDPPLLRVRAHRDSTLIVAGAEVIEALKPQRCHDLPGNTVRYYSLLVHPETSVVIAKSLLNGNEIAIASFGIWRDSTTIIGPQESLSAIPSASDSTIQFNRTLSPWSFEEESHSTYNESSIDQLTHEHSPSLCLLESLHLSQDAISIQEFQRRAIAITKVEHWRLHQETKWLAELAHVEVLTDSRGRRSHVRPLPLQLYPLPTKVNGRYRAIVSGCTSRKNIKDLIARAKQWDCQISFTSSGCQTVPPRLMLLHNQIEAFEFVAEEMQVPWSNQPLPYLIVSTADGIAEWEDRIEWFSGKGPTGFLEYIPKKYIFSRTETVHAPWHLRRIEDPFIRGLLGHTIFKRAWDDNDGIYAFAKDHAWAAWKVQSLAYDDGHAGDPFISKIPYNTSNSSIAIPCSLPLPYYFGRTLSTCSGLPPSRIINNPSYIAKNLDIIPQDSPPYMGPCWEYQNIPKLIATMVADKLGAAITTVTIPTSDNHNA